MTAEERIAVLLVERDAAIKERDALQQNPLAKVYMLCYEAVGQPPGVPPVGPPLHVKIRHIVEERDAFRALIEEGVQYFRIYDIERTGRGLGSGAADWLTRAGTLIAGGGK